LPDSLDPEPLLPEHREGAARVLADAFIDDPGWLSVGPRRQSALRRYIYRTCRDTIKAGQKWCGPSWCITDGGEVVAVLLGCGPGLWPPPELRMLALLAPGSILAGPAVLARSLRAERTIEKGSPPYDHFLVWMFGVSPSRQRSGLGRRLMSQALAVADGAEVPAYLTTAKPDNLPYYRSHGYEVSGEAPLPGGAPLWYMERPVPA
jgi:GNAT superfamily N-acetyltransferase